MVGVDSTVGGHRLLRLLGHGGFGSVYLGRHPEGGLGAVKIMHPQHAGDPGVRERFAREVELARTVASFCTARVIDADPTATTPWVVTEYVEGRTLHETVRLEGPRSGADLHRLAVATTTALAAIHGAGIVHRDFTPANIMLAPDGPRVIDFGVARALEGAGTLSSALIGTPRYMAPEQIEGRPSTSAIDLFAWGSVTVFAATGRAPFDGPNPAAILHRLVSAEPDLSGLPDALGPLVARCLDKDPRHRPTAAELLALLIGAPTEADRATVPSPRAPARPPLSGEPPSGPPPSGAGRPLARARPGEAFAFANGLHLHPGDLAEAMRPNWDRAVALLASPTRRRSLTDWLPPGSPARRWIEDDHGASHDLEVARLVALLRPDLPPVYRGVRMTLSDLARAADDPEAPHDPTVSAAIESGALPVLARHHCAQPGHPCEVGRPCSVYEEVARLVPTTVRLAGDYERWSSPLRGRFTGPLMRVDVRPLTLTAHLVVELSSGRTEEESLERALVRVPQGPWRTALAQGALRTPPGDRRAAAVAVRAVAGVARSAGNAQLRLRGLRNMEESRSALAGEAAFTGVVAFVGAALFTVACLLTANAMDDAGAVGIAVSLSAAAFVWAALYGSRKRRDLRDTPSQSEVDAVERLLVVPDRDDALRALEFALGQLPGVGGGRR
ncbi:protein kinase [Nocardiopsis sp. NPDC006938]|uniref:serine/threonine-protein kinase n=1 Tax=Nocardiopsis sp. NPDC006938 TaxID=3364337 RepID=UPI0036B11FE7